MRAQDYWPICTAHPECGHRINHGDAHAANEYARLHMREYVNRNGYAVCTCHPSSEGAALDVTPFPCDASRATP